MDPNPVNKTKLDLEHKYEERKNFLSFLISRCVFRGVVKQVLDGGAVVIRGPPRNGPPAERTLALTNIDAPRLGTV